MLIFNLLLGEATFSGWHLGEICTELLLLGTCSINSEGLFNLFFEVED